MPLEIERKFLVSGEYKPLATSHSRIVQGYICSERGRTVRVRIRDSRGYLTIKGPATGNGLSRYEFEKEITLDEALSLLNSENESFERPDFLGQEVTGERKYYNSQLRRNPFKNWK